MDQYRVLAQNVSGAARLDEDQLRLWETDPKRSPRIQTIDLLCRLYRTNAQGLGLAGDYHEQPPETVPVVDQGDHAAPHFLQGLAPFRAEMDVTTGPLDRLVEDARRSVDRTLARATVTQAQLDLLDERMLWLRHQYIFTAPIPMLSLLLSEMEEVHALATERQPAAVQTRLSEMTALLATLVADALMKLGKLRQSRAWYATATTAADDSGNVELRARVRAQAAMLPYYYGLLESAVTLAREARLICRNRPTATSVLAAAAEARALARLGDAKGAEHAIHRARSDFEHCDQGADDDAFAFPERRLLLYLSGTYTYLGRNRQARQVQRQALGLYPDEGGIDPALLRLEEAICLAQDRSLTEACQLAAVTYLEVPEQHRTPILGARARHVISVLPPAMRSARAARELGQVLEQPAGR
ncbi:hypothetical protein GCM10012280_30760 [Wenjunlia tyrosinilytica]|uniref:XRE family transcriptional regulator n=1 Tax=Wenjunlia tyrosinilytica TaxID=1544741 RepID=A0A918DYW9_9ACTN|nr:hypothetical protein GCM10012280_30760 [Wenjunlia tyrosinilytica]